ncbi:MAG: MarR family winged helix-turn-helix transcriptional regulator [Candidatus Methanoplasma sp.]|jgi:DNA-binding MarR family transcriptional regulator|nr:MarR family winged helix-turn-helix transcriptional regulator [Candidatus Methanoplasma sp.]
MDYDDLAKEFIKNMLSAQSSGMNRLVQDGFRGEIFVLLFINRTGGRTVPGHISDSAGVSSARIATALNSLEEKGLITREIDSEDRRKIIVRLTQKGAERVEEEEKKKLEEIKNILIRLGEEDAKELVRIMGRVSEVL